VRVVTRAGWVRAARVRAGAPPGASGWAVGAAMVRFGTHGLAIGATLEGYGAAAAAPVQLLNQVQEVCTSAWRGGGTALGVLKARLLFLVQLATAQTGKRQMVASERQARKEQGSCNVM